MKNKPYAVWGLFNFGILWEIGRTRRDCREHARHLMGEKFDRYFRDGSMQIKKVTVTLGWAQ